MSRNICCVPGCPVVPGDNVPLHYFPCPEKDAERFQDWVKIIGGDIASLESSFIHKNRRICRLHFQRELLYRRNRLSKLAVPSLLLPSIDVTAPRQMVPDSLPSTSQKAIMPCGIIKPMTTGTVQYFKPSSSVPFLKRKHEENKVQKLEQAQAPSPSSMGLGKVKDEESSVCMPPEDEDEISVFCPKCDTEVSHTAEGIQNDCSKIIIAKVYHYFEQEYEELKKTYESSDLTPLSNFCQRTALATGVSETTVLEILQEEERRNAVKPEKQVRKRGRPRKRPRQKESSSEEDSFDGDDGEQLGPDDAGDSEVFQQMADVKEEFEDSGADGEASEIFQELADVKDELEDSGADGELADPLFVHVDTELRNEEVDNSNETRTLQPASKRYKGRPRGRKAKALTSLSAPTGASARPGTSVSFGMETVVKEEPVETDKILQAEADIVKMEEIEIKEEGFS